MMNQRKSYLLNMVLCLICCTTCIGFSQQTRREEYDTRLIVAEVEPQSNVLREERPCKRSSTSYATKVIA
jgi:hypothetical protein